jgi:hypothetical protein
VLDYEADVATLSEPVRTKLSTDARTASFDRIRFDQELGYAGRAMLFHRGEDPAAGLIWFDFNPSCAPPVGDNARMCSIDHPIQLDPAAVSCAAQAVDGMSPFLYSRELASKGTLDIHIGSVKYQLALDAQQLPDNRKRFFEMQISKSNQAQTKIRRCGSVEVTNPCTNEAGVGALCVTCIDPAEWFDYCDEYP